jgi:deoxyribodipyrimidine photo-lyase
MIQPERIALLKKGKNSQSNGPVVYWMSRDQRVQHNWALFYAISLANSVSQPLHVVFALAQSFPGANTRHYHFLFGGLIEAEVELQEMGVSFTLLLGDPLETIPSYLKAQGATTLISDFDPLKIKTSWKERVNRFIDIDHYEVDAHNIVPCRFVSDKLEFGAYTLRPKIKKHLQRFLDPFPENPKLKVQTQGLITDWGNAMKWLTPDVSVKQIDWLKPGSKAALNELNIFISKKLKGYAIHRNNPLIEGQSNLSPYLHFGHISAQFIAQQVIKYNAPEEDKSAFLEELIVRRELSDNFCFHSFGYDSIEGFHSWAKATHALHRNDEREYEYSIEQFELAKTHDDLWNAAQLEMVKKGKMHGYLRMYWAKKILEWSKSAEEAMQIAIFLNDKYSLDGRDPNGYAGIAWSIGGVHDRAWSERPVFGKIRYMNYNGCKRKFDVMGYINKVKFL